jgi:hypothetical protein
MLTEVRRTKWEGRSTRTRYEIAESEVELPRFWKLRRPILRRTKVMKNEAGIVDLLPALIVIPSRAKDLQFADIEGTYRFSPAA